MKKKILNLGCGNDTYGTHFIDLYPSRAEVVKCNFDKAQLPFPNNYFDEVYSRNVLEHIKNLGFIFEEIVRVLKPRGKLVLITDNASYYLYHVSKKHSAHYDRYGAHGCEDRHFSLFTTKHLENFCKVFDLNIEKLTLLTDFYPPDTIILYPTKNSRLFWINRFISKLPSGSRTAYPRILLIARK